MRLFSLIFFAFVLAVYPQGEAHALKYSLKLRSEITRAAINGKPLSQAQRKYIQSAKEALQVSGKPVLNGEEIKEETPVEPIQETKEIVPEETPEEIKAQEETEEVKPAEVTQEKTKTEEAQPVEKVEDKTPGKNILEIVGSKKPESVKIENQEILTIPDSEKKAEITFIDDNVIDNKIRKFKKQKKQRKESYLAIVAPENSYDVPMLSFASNEVTPAAKLFLAVTAIKIDPAIVKHVPVAANATVPDTIKPITSIVQKPKVPVIAGLFKREYIVKRGDSFGAIFSRMGYDANFIKSLSKILIVDGGYNPSQIIFGQKFIFTEKVDATGRNLVSLEIPSGLNVIKVLRDANGRITVQQDKKKVTSKYVYKQITVSGSIIASASRATVPSKVVADATRIMANKLDLSTQIHAGDKLDILYEQLYDTRGRIINSGRVFYIGIKAKLANFEAFRFSVNNNDNLVDYYDASGAAFKKSIVNNPFPRKYRITSGFGYRKHPVLGRTMFHSGMDYGAPPGTPIPAAGDGTIVKLGRYGGYGNYIRIKHDGVWQTAYGHMSRYASGMRVWKKVSRGEIIGYVGSTGRSTGPHLHFETLQNGKYINPAAAALPAGRRLGGRDLANFKTESARIKQILSLRKSGN